MKLKSETNESEDSIVVYDTLEKQAKMIISSWRLSLSQLE